MIRLLKILGMALGVFALNTIPLQSALAAPPPPRPGTGITLKGALGTLGPSLRSRSSDPYKAYRDAVRNPPKPPSTTVQLQPYITDPLNEGSPVSSSLAENVIVQIGGKAALQNKIYNNPIILGQGSVFKFPSTQTITDATSIKFNVKVDADTPGHFNTALGGASRVVVIYSTPPNFTDEHLAMAQGYPPGSILESDGSYTLNRVRTDFITYYPTYLPGQFIPVGSRIKKIGLQPNNGWADATVTWTFKDVLYNNKPVSFNSTTIFGNQWLPYEDY